MCNEQNENCTSIVISVNTGGYMGAVNEQNDAQNISRVLYPNDNFFEGKELRLKQEYLLVAATIGDIIRRFTEPDLKNKKIKRYNFEILPDKIAIQLNDTHPALAIPELIRVLHDIYGLDFKTALGITKRCCAYTNHTILPEALERWPVSMLERLLPRHLEIIYLINHMHMEEVSQKYKGDPGLFDKMRKLSIIEEDGGKRVNMAALAIVVTHALNGVARIHSELIKEHLFRDFFELWPEKFQNKTNGITPRRWLLLINPGLSEAINERIGPEWPYHLQKLSDLRQFADDEHFQEEMRQVNQFVFCCLCAFFRNFF